MEEIKDTIAKNLVQLRQKAHLTQLQLAEMLNYSDKAVSKWERGEAIPDIRVILQLANIYNISVDEIVKPAQEGKTVKPKMNLTKKHVLITLLSVGLVWFIATGIFAILTICKIPYSYFSFWCAAIVSSIVLTVFSGVWGNRLTNAISSSLIVWSVVVTIHVITDAVAKLSQVYLIYIAALAFEVLIILWFIFRKVK